MKRAIAKILIEYYYDSHPSHVVTNSFDVDPLPRWLRNWTKRDLQLAEFEIELQRFEHRLVSQSVSHLETWSKATGASEFSVLAQSNGSNFISRHPIAFAALAAGLSGVLISVGWSYWKLDTSSQNPDGIAIYAVKENKISVGESRPSNESVRREIFIRSTWEATKRVASDLKKKSDEVNRALAIVNEREMGKPIREVAHEVLRFVAQKLPQATVRMFGMSAPRDGF
jgi:hypothetical protein